MKKLFLLVSVFTAIAYQLAHARDYYGYERVGRNQPDFIEYEGEYYARVPEQSANVSQPRYQNLNYNEGRVSEPRYQRQSYQQPRFTRLNAEQANEAKFKRSVIDTGTLGVRPYLGLEGAFGTTEYGNEIDKELFSKATKRMGIFAGLQFNQYVGLEAFYHIGNTKEKTISETITDYTSMKLKDTANFNAYGLDLMGYIPVGKAVDIVLGLGYGWYDFKGKVDLNIYNSSVEENYEIKFKGKDKSEAVRFTLGTQFLLNDNWAVRLLGRYADFSSDDAVKNIMEISLGLRYMF